MSTARADHAPIDWTLDELRLALAPAVAEAAMFDGWSPLAVDHAARSLGVAPATAGLAFPGGAMDMIAAWIERIDADMKATFADGHLSTLPVRQRIRTLVQFRLDALDGLDEAVRRALAIMAMPQNVARTARLSWQSADAMWRLAGDKAADFNHYTKRATLAALYAATLLAHVDDRSEDKAETRAFLDRRIEGVMRFERAKARWTRPTDEQFSVTRLLGRLRYPAR